MNINIFFLIIAIALFMIFFLFKPLTISDQKFHDMPLLELENFKLIELNEKGLSTVTKGLKGARYLNDKYTAEKLNHTDNTNIYLANIKSNNADYQGDLIKLNGDVIYSKEDGFSFETQKAEYNKKTKIVESKTSYVSHMNGHKATGSSIKYDNVKEIIKSKNIVANYKLKER